MITAKSGNRSPSLNSNGHAFITDESGNRIPIMVVVTPDSNGHTGLAADAITPGLVSQVTALEDAPLNPAPGTGHAEVIALVSRDGAGNMTPFAPALAASAGKVTGKFQSPQETGTGAVQNIAHGLGVVPSLVLVSVQDNTGAATFTIVEGVHTITNLLITVTTAAKYKVIAFA